MNLNDQMGLKNLSLGLLAGLLILGSADVFAQKILSNPDTILQASPLAAYSGDAVESEKVTLVDSNSSVDAATHLESIMLEFRSISVRSEQMDQIASLMIPGTFQSFSNPLPAAQPIAADAAEAIQTEGEQAKESNDAITLVSATETVTQSFPTYVGKLDGAGMAELIHLDTEDGNSNIKRGAKVTLYSGHTATIADAMLRPFVVDCKPKKVDSFTAHQPVIQCVEQGTILKVRATSQVGKIRLDGDLAIGEVVSVETSDLASQADGKPKGLIVQVPGHKLKQIHWSTTLTDGHTLLIDPQSKQSITEQKHKFGKKTQVEMRTIYLLTAHRIVQENVILERE